MSETSLHYLSDPYDIETTIKALADFFTTVGRGLGHAVQYGDRKATDYVFKQKPIEHTITSLEFTGNNIAADCVRVACGYIPKHTTLEEYTHKFISQDPVIAKILEDINRLAYTRHPVLLRGPTGVGKEILARALHGPREKSFPFVAVNCAAIPASLVEAELFGHTKGAFTGAANEKPGLFHKASNGTLFLDEVFDLPFEVQTKLLRALQPVDGRQYIRRVGSTEDEIVNCRIVAASCASDSGVRKDFLARISTFDFYIPGLNKRPGDAELIWKSLFPNLPQPKELDISFNTRSLISQAERLKLADYKKYMV